MLIERLLKVALLGSEWVLYLLAFLSMLSFTIMAERFFFFRKHRGDVEELGKRLSAELSKGDLGSAAQMLNASRTIEGQVAVEALRWAYAGPEAVADAVDAELARRKKDLEAGTNFLGTVGNNSPFVGLFGTVLGVIIAFEALGKAGGNASAMGSVMAGIAEALVATGVGLFVALPAVVAYNIVQKRIGEVENGAVALTKLVCAFIRARKDPFPKLPAVIPDSKAKARTDSAADESNSNRSSRTTLEGT
jgi:biopolymer transport protein ExbB/biopolymer transport protein TolQ